MRDIHFFQGKAIILGKHMCYLYKLVQKGNCKYLLWNLLAFQLDKENI